MLLSHERLFAVANTQGCSFFVRWEVGWKIIDLESDVRIHTKESVVFETAIVSDRPEWANTVNLGAVDYGAVRLFANLVQSPDLHWPMVAAIVVLNAQMKYRRPDL